MVTVVVFSIPLQEPVQPSNREPGEAVAVKLTVVPSKYSILAFLQEVSQSIAVSGEVEYTSPVPAPRLLTTNLNSCGGIGSSVTVTICSTGCRLLLKSPYVHPAQQK